jgi:hypothetical protein
MGVKTNDANVMDYTDDFEAIRSEIEGVKTNISAVNDTLQAILDVQTQMLARMENQNEGIYMRSVVDTSDLGYAATIVSLRESNLLDDVRTEMQNPTEMP